MSEDKNQNQAPEPQPQEPQPQGQPNSKPAIQLKQTAAETNIKIRLNELVNVNRIVTNGINLIADVSIKGAHAGPVAEFLNWLSGFSQSLTTQIKTLEATLPKTTEPKATDDAKPPTVKPEAFQHAIANAAKTAGATTPVEPVAASLPDKAKGR